MFIEDRTHAMFGFPVAGTLGIATTNVVVHLCLNANDIWVNYNWLVVSMVYIWLAYGESMDNLWIIYGSGWWFEPL